MLEKDRLMLQIHNSRQLGLNKSGRGCFTRIKSMRVKLYSVFFHIALTLMLSFNCLAQNSDLQKKVDEAFDDVRQKRFEKVSELVKSGEQILPYLSKYYRDPSEVVRREALALVRNIRNQEALEVLGNFLTDNEYYLSVNALESIHKNYLCSNIRQSKIVRNNLLKFISKTPYSAKAVLLLSCFNGDPEVRRVIEEKRTYKGTHDDGGIHYGVPFNLGAELALAEMGDSAAVGKVLEYIKQGDVKNLFFILDNIKFVNNKEIRQSLVELLNDKRPVYEPVSHMNFYLRVCDLALAALTSNDAALISVSFEKQRTYTDEELKTAYRKLKKP